MGRFGVKFSAWAIYAAVVALYGFSFWALMGQRDEATAWQWGDVLPLLKYSLGQAALSALLAVLFGLFAARAFFYLDFRGKWLLYKIFSFVWSLPALVVIFAVIGVWGNSGWLAAGVRALGGEWSFSLYGLQGIVLAHLLFNIPLACKYSLSALALIPSNQQRLAAQLGLVGWRYFQTVELPVLKLSLPYSFVTIFLICFTSFPIVLMLGGSPKYSTLEVAIYQAVTFEFDFAKAVMLIVVQVVIGLALQVVSEMSSRRALLLFQAQRLDGSWRLRAFGWRKVGLQVGLFVLCGTILLPLLSVIWHGLTVSNLAERLTNPQLLRAIGFSLGLSAISALTVVVIAYVIALEARQLAYCGQKGAQVLLSSVTNFPLIIPVFLLAVGLFLLLMDVDLSNGQLLWLVGVCNGLMLLPYIYRLLFAAMWQTWITQDKLARSLGLQGFRRWWIAEKAYLIKPLRNALALALSSGLGSFSVIAFFGNADFSALPYLLYQQLGSYRTEDAAVTALVLMLFALLPFLWLEQQENG